MRRLARRIDAQIRAATDVNRVRRRIRAWFSGVSEAELAMREALPFAVTEVFLIHRQTGLLLWHIAQAAASVADREVMSGMLTAIRDFASDMLGGGEDGLDQIQYGDRSILIDASEFAYEAVVSEGIEPIDFQARLHERLLRVADRYAEPLAHYRGDPDVFAGVAELLAPLMGSAS
jgi:hypothetical protein